MTNALKPLYNPLKELGDPAELNELARKMIEEKKRLAEQGGSVEEQNPAIPEPAQPTQTPTIITLEDCIELQNIQCTDASGNVFEKYDSIYVMKDVVRNKNGTHKSFTPYQAIVHMKEQGLILPSMALSCNILALLYANKADAEIKKVLMQYKDHGSGYGWHAQNTVVDWKNKKIIHNPNDKDFPNNEGNDKINSGRQKHSYSFNPKSFGDMLFEEALKNKEYAAYLKNLTGLAKPEILQEIGEYFGKPAKTWVSNNPTKANNINSVWLGCGDVSFNIYACDNLGSNGAARGVLLQRPQGARQK